MTEVYTFWGGTRWCRRLRHCATSRKVSGSIHSGRTMALGSTQPLTEMSIRNVGGQRQPVRKASCADCLDIWEPQPSVTLRACNRPVQALLYLYNTFWRLGGFLIWVRYKIIQKFIFVDFSMCCIPVMELPRVKKLKRVKKWGLCNTYISFH